MDGERAGDPSRPPALDEAREREREQVVAGDHEQVVVQPGTVEHERDIADRAEAVVVRGRPVVVDRHVAPGGPGLELDRLLRVRDDVDGIESVHFAEPVEDPVDDRPAADREELLRDRVRQRAEPRGVPGREDDRLHVPVALPAQVPSSQEAR